MLEHKEQDTIIAESRALRSKNSTSDVKASTVEQQIIIKAQRKPEGLEQATGNRNAREI